MCPQNPPRLLNEAAKIEMDSIKKSPPPPPGPENYTHEFYENAHGRDATAGFFRAVGEVKAIVTRNGWELKQKNTMYYVGFKAGKLRPFAVHWSGKSGWNLQVKVPEPTARVLRAPSWEMQRYDGAWGHAVFRPTRPDSPVTELVELLQKAVAGVDKRRRQPHPAMRTDRKDGRMESDG